MVEFSSARGDDRYPGSTVARTLQLRLCLAELNSGVSMFLDLCSALPELFGDRYFLLLQTGDLYLCGWSEGFGISRIGQ